MFAPHEKWLVTQRSPGAVTEQQALLLQRLVAGATTDYEATTVDKPPTLLLNKYY